MAMATKDEMLQDSRELCDRLRRQRDDLLKAAKAAREHLQVVDDAINEEIKVGRIDGDETFGPELTATMLCLDKAIAAAEDAQ